VSEEVAWHEFEIGDVSPAVRQSSFWFVSVCTLTPLLLMFFVTVTVFASSAKALCAATELTANIPASAAITTSTVARAGAFLGPTAYICPF
jgi:flavin reductase (DIM6/NTAB) family NADH-FMN oxidoreductase RutF